MDKLKCIGFCGFGVEDVLENDIREILGKKVKVEKNERCCIFEANKEDIARFAFMCQSIEKVGVLLKNGEIGDIPEIDVSDIKFDIKTTFYVDCSIAGTKPYKSNDVVMNVSEQMMKTTKKKAVYKDAGIEYNIEIIGNKYFFTINLSSKELSNRDYKVFANKTSLRGTIAYALCRMADIKDGEKVLDPFCRSGEIGIELIHNVIGKSVNHYAKDKFLFSKIDWEVKLDDEDKDSKVEVNLSDAGMPNIKAAEKNAKIAGVNKKLNFSRILIEDLDLKYENIDKIITRLPTPGKETKGKILHIFRQFFEVSKKILKPKGIILCIGTNIEDAIDIAKHNDYVLLEKKEVMQGKEVMRVYKFG
ncbi:hypothetical protein H6503_01075 [Candidatus Woesearchaeota archaeon]|nr:hypothetical protein [Candidatus Woesearchaeota archaeon]